MNITAPTTRIAIKTNRPKKNGNFTLYIRVTFNRKSKYYPLQDEITKEDFDSIWDSKRKQDEQSDTKTLSSVRGKKKEIKIKAEHQKQKAEQALESLEIFTFESFEKLFFDKINVINSVSDAFSEYIAKLEFEQRVGTAESYKNARNSLDKFKKNMTFAEITPRLLMEYQEWMTKQGRSKTTVGIYLRSLRAVYNLQDLPNHIYPFGKNKFSIPKGRNIKKALSFDEVGKIFNYSTQTNTEIDQAKDYWIFMYLCNGMNVKDLCNLKWKNKQGDTLTYVRAKTKRSKDQEQEIHVSLKVESLAIIKKWGKHSLNDEDYIFPHYKQGITERSKMHVSKSLTKFINKHMGQISQEIGLEVKATTYHARHSFATLLKRSGVSTEMISELLGHSSLEVTKSYLAGFESEQIKQATDVLTNAFKKTS